MKPSRLVMLSVLVAAILIASTALAQGGPPSPAPTVLTPAFVVTSALGLVLGFLTMAYNTGSVLGLATVPKPALPWISLAVTFLGGFLGSLGPSPSMTGASFYVAFLAGVGALLSAGGGAGLHAVVTAHLSSRGVAAATKPAANTNATARGFSPLGLLVGVGGLGLVLGLVLALSGCALFSKVEAPAVDCGKRILDDAAAGMTVTQIVDDVAGPCAVDAAAVMAALLASKDPGVHATRAYAEARRAHDAQVAP